MRFAAGRALGAGAGRVRVPARAGAGPGSAPKPEPLEIVQETRVVAGAAADAPAVVGLAVAVVVDPGAVGPVAEVDRVEELSCATSRGVQSVQKSGVVVTMEPVGAAEVAVAVAVEVDPGVALVGAPLDPPGREL